VSLTKTDSREKELTSNSANSSKEKYYRGEEDVVELRIDLYGEIDILKVDNL
jgi:hypothetical protein